MKIASEELRVAILSALASQGFDLEANRVKQRAVEPSKAEIRERHRHDRMMKLQREADFVSKRYHTLKNYFADGWQIDPLACTPRVVPVEAGSEQSDLFRFATLLWSIPVSQGFGRRLRFLVFDEFNGKLIGLFALGDPVFNLAARDKWIGWTHRDRAERLYNVLDVFVLGAVPPYSHLLGGKMIALLAASDEVRRQVWSKYAAGTTIIQGASKRPHLALLSTTSALGRSSLYNRVQLDGQPLYQRVGATHGWGHFHLSNGTFELMRKYLAEAAHPIEHANRFGQGPNWKMRAVRTCLEMIGLPSDLLRHGIKRDVYVVELAINSRAFLRGEHARPRYRGMPASDLVTFFKSRWLIPRSKRRPDYIDVRREAVLSELRSMAR
jgi:hypothetical protein